MNKPLMRIPYTELFPPPATIPHTARSLPGAVAALQEFFHAPPPRDLPRSTVVLTGAGLSVASGLADYRGANGTYRVNKTYRPIYYHEFLASHEARKRYWARSFLGWTTLRSAAPNAGHYAVRDLGRLGLVSRVITQNVDSFHPRAHPDIPTLELHGYLRSTVCTSCWNEFPRDVFQGELARLNPVWDAFLREAIASGALATEDPHEKRARGIRLNPDGDVELPEAPYTTFRYPACPKCLSSPPMLADGRRGTVEVDGDGAWSPTSNAGILKPAVVMFGESIANGVKQAAEDAIDGAGRLLVLATSLATYSAWRLAKRAKDRGMPIAIVNIGGVRGEDAFFADLDPSQKGGQGVRVEMSTDSLLPAVVHELRQPAFRSAPALADTSSPDRNEAAVFKNMLQ
ncbi:fb51d26d-56fe-41f1-afe5-bf68d44df3c1 [Thermothielavioides terrestris]|uniref:SIR2 family histone deacetylase-like protein n=2 Tax=Thermothielavioides terrestris TaxID=2587410 RepID=G2R9B2_THETT|nr:SIR2 family histone deacetylase-like protein [Thermothielavioides terrestris NRRL 8126]AEO69510.1 SIR2 family histone deacetylase-like protein [Thermothielavioides terrestris NRRL 8126]SPQ26023.1 fb51d26d-56fe-41f1-afe5-bf68d44df3c1 [Thermothielavioides terrestris]